MAHRHPGMLVLFLVKALTFSRADATSCSDSEYKAVEVYKPLIPNYQNCPLSPTATLMTVDASSTGTELGSTITRGQNSPPAITTSYVRQNVRALK